MEQNDFNNKLIEYIDKDINLGIPKYAKDIIKLIDRCELHESHSYSSYIIKNKELGFWIQPYHLISEEIYKSCINNLNDIKTIIHEYHRITISNIQYSLFWYPISKRFIISKRNMSYDSNNKSLRKYITHNSLKKIFNNKENVYNNLNNYFEDSAYTILENII